MLGNHCRIFYPTGTDRDAEGRNEPSNVFREANVYSFSGNICHNFVSNLSQLEGQEYPTEPLDKIPALQAKFELTELAGKKNIG